MLKFLGIGNLFNTEFGNTSCYKEIGKNLLIIDVGTFALKPLIDSKIMLNKDNIFVYITHNHPDHIAGLGSLIFYAYYVLNKKIKIIYPMASKQKSNITKFLSLQGISTIKYNIISEKQFSISGIKELKCDRVKHSNLESFALKIIYKDNKKDIFIGDNGDIDYIKKQASLIGKDDFIYTDVSLENLKSHLNLNSLSDVIEAKKRKNVVCVHFADHKTKLKAQELGFSVANIEL